MENQVQTSEVSQPTQFSVPETYKDQSWAQNIKSPDDLWGQFANAQTLIGKRPAGIPTAEAPPEEWDRFYTAKGRPESPDKYNLESKFEGLPEGVDLAGTEAKAKAFFHKLGLSPREAQTAWNDYIGMELEGLNEHKTQQEARQAELDKEFETLATKMWGDKYKDVEAKSLETIKTSVPDELKEAIPYIAENPKALAATIKIIESAEAQANQLRSEMAELKRKYGVEDKLATGQQVAASGKDEIVKRLTEANMKVRTLDPFSPERKTLMGEIENLRGELAKVVR